MSSTAQEKPFHILVVDDEEAISWSLQRAFISEGWPTHRVASAEAALKYLPTHPVDLVLLDIRLPGMDGLAAMSAIHQHSSALPIILMTAFGTLNIAIAALRGEASEYLTKPFDLNDAITAVRRCRERARQDTLPAPTALDDLGSEGIIGQSPGMQAVFKNIALVAATDLPVLIVGESGTGKELVARAIHRHSQRADRPLFPVHLASLSPSLMESELFGHVKGAFTGSERDRQGVLEMAHQATVFFDEAGDIPPTVQVKLLRTLEQREIVRVGDALPRPADFRVITATNCDLGQAIEEGRVRRDFYFRVAGFVISLPPLRERQDDIVLLANFFLQRTAPSHAGFSEAALALLRERAWPGNVRELRQTVEHASILARGDVIRPHHLPTEQVLTSRNTTSLTETVKAWAKKELAHAENVTDLYSRFLAQTEPTLIQEVLTHTSDNRTLAADILGIDRTTLRKKLGS